MGLSAVLITKDEEKNIRACLESVSFVDEIVIVDSGSNDRTMELARPLATQLVSRSFDDFSSQKNFAAGLARQDWVLSVDADERVSWELREEILRVIREPREPVAYAIRRHTNLFGRDFVAGGLQDDAPIRLFRRGKAVFENPVHETLKVNGKVGKLNSALHHVSFQTIGEHLAKLQLYTGIQARRSSIGRSPGKFSRYFGRPFYRFFRIYVLKQGFRDGQEGFIYAVLSGYYEWVRWMKRWEIDESR
jgi:glycosyltransferase involved in cell wall biosynthesis